MLFHITTVVHFMCLFILQLASQILSSLSKENNGPYASNWLERLRQIKRIQYKVLNPEGAGQPTGPSSEPMAAARAGPSTSSTSATAGSGRTKVQMSDFTEYT